jgi:hypothetical protein
VLPCFSRTREGTSSTIDLRAAFKTGVKTRLNGRESMLRKTLKESSPVPAPLKLELELESMYIRLISL